MTVVAPARDEGRWIDAALVAALVLLATTEALSAFGALGRTGSLLTLMVTGAGAAAKWRASRSTNGSARPPGRLDPRGAPVLVLLGVVVVIVFVVGITSGPSNNDVLSYHLPRVMHWLQQGSVDHYPTDIERQLFLGPFPAYLVMHLVAATGTDGIVFLPAWASWVGSGFLAGAIARHVGLDRHGQVLAAVFALTVPMGVLQAASAQTDLPTAFWCMVALASLVVPSATGRRRCLRFGAAAGLAVLCKATAGLFLLAPALFLSWRQLRHHRLIGLLPLGAAAGLALIIITPWAVRNIDSFGRASGPLDDEILVAEVTPATWASTAVRDLATQVPLLEAPVKDLHDALGWDASAPSTTWGVETFRTPPLLSTHEEDAPSPVHVILIAVATIISVFQRRLRLVAITYWGGFLAFAAIVQWQPWHNRLLLPLVIVAAPLVPLAVRSPSSRRLVAACLVVLALPYVLFNHTRPLLRSDSVLTSPGEVDMFRRIPDLRADFEAAADAVRGCDRIEISASEFAWEYPIWPLTAAGPFGPTTIRYAWSTDEPPCAAIRISQTDVTAIRRPE